MGYRRSSLPNLYVDERTGIYYVRTKVGGRTVWKSLGTDEFRVAKLRAPKALAELVRGRAASRALDRGRATFGELAELYRTRTQQDTRLKPSSKHYRCQTIDSILKLRPQWKERFCRDIGQADCLEWAAARAAQVHGTRFNNETGTLRAIFELGVQHGLLASNPAILVAKRRVTPKRLELPSKGAFAAILTEIESSGSWCGADAADLVRFLAYSGCRLSEAAQVRKEDVFLEAGTICIRGDSVHSTKGGQERTIPINTAMRELLARLLDDRREPRDPKRQGKGYLLKVTTCRRALANACRRVGVTRIGHHDLRHLFITRAIEAEIPVPTIAKWAGHKDGGALLMRTYSHLLDEHSRAMAARLTF